jgi:pyruvate,orthophosphate dikinase
VLSESRARERHAAGVPLVLVRAHADTHDIDALALSDGLLTRQGARTSHAAVVARQLGKVCLVGCDALVIDEAERSIRFGTTVLSEGDLVTIDGNDGAIYGGEMRVEERVPHELVARLARLAADEA